MPGPVRTVHLVAKTHLDLGFTDLAADVAARYVERFFPRAVAVAHELRRRGGPERLVWTTGSWVLHHALASGSAAQRASVERAVVAGDLAWHALPLTTHTELMDVPLARAALGISGELDERFGRCTTAAKMTDVPGHTRGLVPLLAEAGVTFLHLGVNPAWPVPDVPPVFRWRSPDDTEVVVAYQAGGYGGEVVVPGCAHVLAFLHAGDNLGPPSADEVVAAHAQLAARYPGAEVRGSTLDAFARALAASGAVDALPVVTAEIGDPWLFGAGSDPLKVAGFRAVLRARRRLPGEVPEPVRADLDRRLLLVAEHTWGLDQKEALPDRARWDRTGLAELRATPAGERFEASWAEQRAYVDEVARRIAELSPSVGITSIAQAAAEIHPWPLRNDAPPGGWTPLAPGQALDGGRWEIGFDRTGAVAHLVHRASGRTVADPDHRLGTLRYQSFDEADYERFYAGLEPTADDDWWARLDNTKPGIDAAGATSATWAPTSIGTWHRTHQGGAWHDVLERVGFEGPAADRLGAPGEAWLRWFWSAEADPQQPDVDELELTVWWSDKPANRLPEATWCSFVPVVAEPRRWQLDKLGQLVSPLDVVRRGGRGLHAVGEGMTYDGPDGVLQIATHDAPLVAPGAPCLLDADPPVPDLAGGFHVLLHDNCWGTNFPMWCEGPARFAFTIRVGLSSAISRSRS